MKKKIVTLILTIATMLMCIFGFSACEEQHTHEYAPQTTKVANCTEKGLITYTCSCGDSYTEEISATGVHTWDDGEETKASTCTKEGETTYTCTVCKTATKTEPIGKLTHEYGTEWESNATHHWHECVCGDKDGEKNHNPGVVATETTDQICTECKRVLVPALGHVHTLHLTKVEAKAQSCTETGNIEYYTCSCEKWFEDSAATAEIKDKTSVVIVKDDHSYTEFKQSTIQHWYECICGAYEIKENHEGGSSTCINLAVCSVCSKEYGELVACSYKNGACIWCGDSFFSEGLIYKLINYNREYKVSGIGTCVDTDLIIPDMHNGKPVTSIGYSAFENNKSIKSLVIPNSITSIDSYAFSGCSNLESIELPSNVTTICWTSFMGTKVNYTVENNIKYLSSKDNPYFVVMGVESKTGSYIINEKTKVIANGSLQYGRMTTIEIPNSVTNIGSSAFYNCSSLTSVTFEENSKLTSIGASAFYKCSSLTSVEIPDSIIDIADTAFDNCDKLAYNTERNLKYLGNKNNKYLYLIGITSLNIQSASINSNCKIIRGGVFANSLLESIFIPASIKSIGRQAFYSCENLKSITVDYNNTVYKSIDDDLYSKDGKTLVRYAQGKEAISFTILKEVEIIDYDALSDCSNLKDILVEENSLLKIIKSQAFSGCNNLNTITIPRSVEIIEDSCFYDCRSSLTIYCAVKSKPDGWFGGDNWRMYDPTGAKCCSVVWEGGVVRVNGIQYIVEGGFATVDKRYENGSNDLEIVSTVIYDSKVYNVTFIDERAFYGCSSLTSILIPDSVTSIGSYAFYNCSRLTSVHITDIAAWCNISFGVYEANPLCHAENLYLKNELVTELVIPDSVTSIDSYAFYNCSRLTSVEIGDNVTTIGNYAFSFCYRLTSVVIPDGVTSIGGKAFYNCGRLTSVVIPDGVTSIDSAVFYGCSSLTSVVIPDSVTTIGGSAFYDCSSLTSVVIPDSVTAIGGEAFYGCGKLVEVVNKSTHIKVTKGETDNGYVGYYALAIYNSDSGITESQLINDNGYIIYMEGTEKILVGYNGTETDLVLPSYITEINQRAFSGCYNLTSVTIPDGVTSIGDDAFYGCYKLVEVVNKSTHITVRKGAVSNGYVGYYALAVYNSGDAFTRKLSNDNGYIIYTDGNEKILVGYNGTETDLVLPSYITKINQYAFRDCDSLMSVVIPESVTSIGYCAFYNCSNLTSVLIGDGVTTIGYYAFYKCSRLTSLIIGGSVTTIGDVAFCNCESLASVVIPDGVTSIGFATFQYCGSLTSVIIPDGVTTIGDGVFQNCSNLTSILYRGTQTQWNAITKGSNWDYNTGDYTITYNYQG